MKALFHNFLKNIGAIFSGKNLIWHALAIILTYILVITGFDWYYFQFFEGGKVYRFLFSAAVIGGLFPILVPITLFVIGKLKKNMTLTITAFALAQAAILGSLISSLYKAFTGRAHPDPFTTIASDITHMFQFGFLRAGVFWGWPSSHTTIAFAMVLTLVLLFTKNKYIKILALLYAFFIGIGVSMSIHWFSDFIAGALIGSVIGIVVGKSFRKLIQL